MSLQPEPDEADGSGLQASQKQDCLSSELNCSLIQFLERMRSFVHRLPLSI